MVIAHFLSPLLDLFLSSLLWLDPDLLRLYLGRLSRSKSRPPLPPKSRLPLKPPLLKPRPPSPGLDSGRQRPRFATRPQRRRDSSNEWPDLSVRQTSARSSAAPAGVASKWNCKAFNSGATQRSCNSSRGNWPEYRLRRGPPPPGLLTTFGRLSSGRLETGLLGFAGLGRKYSNLSATLPGRPPERRAAVSVA
jgi:hypothetical protein